MINWIPTEECADWCLNQRIAIEYNIEITAVLFAGLSLVMLLTAELFKERGHPQIADILTSLAVTSLYIFFFVYFVVIKMGLYHYGF